VLLVVVLVVAVGLYLWYSRTPAGSGARASNSVTPAAAPVGSLPLPDPLKFAALSAEPAHVETVRNPFAFGVRPPPPAPPRVELPPPPVLPPPPPPPPSGPPPIALKLLGVFIQGTDKRTMVTLKDPAGAMIFQAFEGDIVDGRYRVVKVGLQSVVVSYVDGSGQRTIGLTGG
jgi:hypothetical protein